LSSDYSGEKSDDNYDHLKLTLSEHFKTSLIVTNNSKSNFNAIV